MTKKEKKKAIQICPYCRSKEHPMTYSYIEWCKQDKIYEMVKLLVDVLT